MLFVSLEKRQKRVCKKYNLSFFPTSLDSIAGIADNIFDGIEPINGLRHPPEANTCGWYLWAGENITFSDNFLKPMCLKHLEKVNKNIFNYLALPPGGRFLIAENYEDVWYDKSLLNLNE